MPEVVSPDGGWWTIGGGECGQSAKNATASATSRMRTCGAFESPGEATLLAGLADRRASDLVTERDSPCTPGGRYITAAGFAWCTSRSPSALERAYGVRGSTSGESSRHCRRPCTAALLTWIRRTPSDAQAIATAAGSREFAPPRAASSLLPASEIPAALTTADAPTIDARSSAAARGTAPLASSESGVDWIRGAARPITIAPNSCSDLQTALPTKPLAPMTTTLDSPTGPCRLMKESAQFVADDLLGEVLLIGVP